MKTGCERRALTTEGHVATPEIGHHGDTGAHGNGVRVADLQGKPVCPERLVVDRLPMRAQGTYLVGLQPRIGQGTLHRRHVLARHGQIEQPKLRQGQRLAVADRQNLLAQLGRIRRVRMRQHAHIAVRYRPRVAGETGQHHIHSVQAGAGHGPTKYFVSQVAISHF